MKCRYNLNDSMTMLYSFGVSVIRPNSTTTTCSPLTPRKLQNCLLYWIGTTDVVIIIYLFRQHAFWVLNFTCICRRPVIFCSCYSILGNFRFLLLLEQVSEDIAVSYFSPNTKKIGAQKISDIFFQYHKTVRHLVEEVKRF